MTIQLITWHLRNLVYSTATKCIGLQYTKTLSLIGCYK